MALGLGLSFIAQARADPVKVVATPGPPLDAPEVVATLPRYHTLRGVGADGAGGVWFAENGDSSDESYLVHYRPAQLGLMRKLVKPTQQGYSEVIDGVAPGPDGNEWFARFYDDEISHIDATGKLMNKKLPAGSNPDSLAVGGDGTVWFAERGHGCHLGRLSTSGKLSSRGIGFFANGVAGDCNELTVAPNNHVWVTTYSGEAVDEFSPDGVLLNVYPAGLSVGIASVGTKVWVTSIQPASVTSISESGEEVEYQLPAGVVPQWSTAGPDGAVWFLDYGPNGSAIGRLTAAGEFSEVPLPDGGGATRLTSSGGAVYFTMGYGGDFQALMRIWPEGSGPSDNSSYASLGDSYSSGEGNPPYESGTDDSQVPDLCHRSSAAYGSVLDGAAGLGPPIFAACSGAVTNDIFDASAKYPSEPAQRSRLRNSTKTVTITIGGNDVGFASALEQCVTVAVVRPHFGCSKSKSLEAETQARMTAFGGGSYATTPPPASQPIHSVLSVIHAIHADAPAARIFIGLYPMLFGKYAANYAFNTEAPSGSACEVGNFLGEGLWIDYKDAQWLNKRGAQLNGIIVTATNTAIQEGIAVQAVKPSGFNRHGFCDEQERWFYPLELELQHIFEVGTNLSPKPSSFHPTAVGQQAGYEIAFAAKVK